MIAVFLAQAEISNESAGRCLPLNVVLLGPPGTGKGTIAQFLHSECRYAHISTGDALRDEVKNSTEIGRKIKPMLEAGELVGDGVVGEVLRKKLAALPKSSVFVLDGYPRNIRQAGLLDGILAETGRNIGIVVCVSTPDETIVKRLSARRQCGKCGAIYGIDIPPKNPETCDACGSALYQRDDDKPETVRKRLKVYHETTEPIIEFYRKKKLLRRVNGNQPLEGVLRDVGAMVKSAQA